MEKTTLQEIVNLARENVPYVVLPQNEAQKDVSETTYWLHNDDAYIFSEGEERQLVADLLKIAFKNDISLRCKMPAIQKRGPNNCYKNIHVKQNDLPDLLTAFQVGIDKYLETQRSDINYRDGMCFAQNAMKKTLTPAYKRIKKQA